jgi:ABC-type phosphate transport system substrate-binding protein
MKIAQAAAIFLASAGSVLGNGEVITIHGSGTTNPSKCIWHIMSLFEERSQIMTRLTYRAVGSSTGQKEFLGAANTGYELTNSTIEISSHVPHNDFGAGDIPISKAAFEELNKAVELQDGANNDNNGLHMVHLPFAMSSVSFFHNIPGIERGPEGIKLDACDLARIYNGKVSRWNDAEIISKQTEMIQEILLDIDEPIFVSRRVEGSSSTQSITQFLHEKCPAEWPLEWVDSMLGDKWHVSTKPCQGSAGMTDCVRQNAGAIGYLDSGHGWSEELAEVYVKNEDGVYLTSEYSFSQGGITYAASSGVTPDRADADWSSVEFLNKSGPDTWPIVLMSYVYVRKDVNRFMDSKEERGLLKLFLEALYDDDEKKYFEPCEKLGFAPPPKDVKTVAIKGIESITWDLDNNKNMWTHEIDTLPITGMGKYVISAKRRSLAGVSIDEIAGAEAKLKGDVEYLTASFQSLMQGTNGEFAYLFRQMEAENNKTEAALVLAALSFTMWSCVIVGFVVKRFVFHK